MVNENGILIIDGLDHLAGVAMGAMLSGTHEAGDNAVLAIAAYNMAEAMAAARMVLGEQMHESVLDQLDHFAAQAMRAMLTGADDWDCACVAYVAYNIAQNMFDEGMARKAERVTSDENG